MVTVLSSDFVLHHSSHHASCQCACSQQHVGVLAVAGLRQPSNAMPKQVDADEPCGTYTSSTAVVTLPIVQVSHSLRFAALPSLHVQHTRV